MAGISNDFSWSFTRRRTFQDCRRAYYYNYYGYWNGWSDDAPDQARLAYRLKKMVTLPMWLGDIVHRMIERIIGDLRNRELNTLENYQRQARKILNREWVQSVEKRWQWKPKYNLNLFEHYYGVGIEADERRAARDKVYKCLANFMESDVFAHLAQLGPEDWRTVEALDRFPVGDWPVFVKIDCATRYKGLTCIYDWKTGKKSEDTLQQLGCYALYAFHVWKVPLESQRLVPCYLDQNETETVTPDAEQLLQTKDLILRSMQEMIDALHSSPEQNEAREQDFPMTERTGLCRRCQFREICFGDRERLPD